VARLVVNILKFTKATTDAGAIKIFFNTLNTVLETINTLLENKFIKAVFNATGKVLAFVLALGTIGKIGNFGIKTVTGSIDEIGKLVKAIVPGPVLASVKSGLDTIALKGMYAFDKVKKGAIDTAKAIATEIGGALKQAGTQIADYGKKGAAQMAEFGKAAGLAAKDGLTFLLTKLNLLRVFLLTNPIGIAITAITVLAGLFVLLYRNSETFREAVQKAFERIKEGATMALEWLRQNWPVVLAVLTGPFGLMVLAIARNWDTIVATVRGIPARLREAGSAAWTWLTSSLATAWTAVQTRLTEIVAGVRALPGRIGNGLSNIWSGLTDGLRNAWNNARAWWNANVATRKLKIGGATVLGQTLPSFTLGFPQLAKGGIVPATPGGTIARIGEAGRPERVEPLDPQGLSKRDRAMIQMLAGGSGAGATINVYPSQGMNESELASIISRQIAFQLRRGGA
jgi:phage-related protein